MARLFLAAISLHAFGAALRSTSSLSTFTAWLAVAIVAGLAALRGGR